VAFVRSAVGVREREAERLVVRSRVGDLPVRLSETVKLGLAESDARLRSEEKDFVREGLKVAVCSLVGERIVRLSELVLVAESLVLREAELEARVNAAVGERVVDRLFVSVRSAESDFEATVRDAVTESENDQVDVLLSDRVPCERVLDSDHDALRSAVGLAVIDAFPDADTVNVPRERERVRRDLDSV